MDQARERQLTRAAQGCSRDAFGELVTAYEQPLCTHVLGWGLPRHDAEDMVQEIWAEAWERIHRGPNQGGYDPQKGRFYTWVVYVARYKILDWWRKRREHVGLPEDADGQLPAGPFLPPDDRDASTERLRLLVSCELFRLSFLCGGYPHEQLAFGWVVLNP